MAAKNEDVLWMKEEYAAFHDSTKYILELGDRNNAEFSVEKTPSMTSMKKIINGVTYNTETSVDLGSWSVDGGRQTLYQTKSGNLFLIAQYGLEFVTGRLLCPVTIDEAIHWVSLHDERKSLSLAEMLSKQEDDTPTATMVRIPPSLMSQITNLAKGAGMSRNEWIMHCLEDAARDEYRSGGSNLWKLPQKED